MMWDDRNASRMCVECATRSLVHGCSQNESSLSNNNIKFERVASDSSKARKIGSECTFEAMYRVNVCIIYGPSASIYRSIPELKFGVVPLCLVVILCLHMLSASHHRDCWMG